MDLPVQYHDNHSFNIDLNEDQPQYDDQLFHDLINPQISSSLALSYPIEDQGQFFSREQLQQSLQADHKIVSSGGSCDHHHHPKADQEIESDNNNDLKLRIWKNDENNTIADSVKWTSSKMRMMKKMIITNTDHHHNHDQYHDHDHRNGSMNFMKNFVGDHQRSPSDSSSNLINNNNNGIIRVCSDCNTTKTPLWRSGPRGPKSLCNACGIRQRKARRAMAAASGTIVEPKNKVTTASNKVQHKAKKSKISIVGEGSFGNKPKSSKGGKKLLCFEDMLRISMNKSSAYHHRVFPQDEKDAAILLMALSYGLVHG